MSSGVNFHIAETSPVRLATTPPSRVHAPERKSLTPSPANRVIRPVLRSNCARGLNHESATLSDTISGQVDSRRMPGKPKLDSSIAGPLVENCRLGCDAHGQRKLIASVQPVCDLKRGFLKPLMNGYDVLRRKRTTLRVTRSKRPEECSWIHTEVQFRRPPG